MASSAELAADAFDRGETVNREVTVVNQDLSAKNLTGATIQWAIVDVVGSAVSSVLTVGNGIIFNGAPSLGVIIASFDKAETEGYTTGVYYHELVIVDSAGERQIYRGTVSVREAALPVAA